MTIIQRLLHEELAVRKADIPRHILTIFEGIICPSGGPGNGWLRGLPGSYFESNGSRHRTHSRATAFLPGQPNDLSCFISLLFLVLGNVQVGCGACLAQLREVQRKGFGDRVVRKYTEANVWSNV